MSLSTQIDFWSSEVKRTSDKAHQQFHRHEFAACKETLKETKAALNRLRWEAEQSNLLNHPELGPTLQKDLEVAETELQGLIQLANEALS